MKPFLYNMELIFILALVMCFTVSMLSGCASTPLEKKRIAIKECIENFMDRDASPKDAYTICNGIYNNKKKR